MGPEINRRVRAPHPVWRSGPQVASQPALTKPEPSVSTHGGTHAMNTGSPRTPCVCPAPLLQVAAMCPLESVTPRSHLVPFGFAPKMQHPGEQDSICPDQDSLAWRFSLPSNCSKTGGQRGLWPGDHPAPGVVLQLGAGQAGALATTAGTPSFLLKEPLFHLGIW